MKAVLLSAAGSIDNLYIGEIDEPTPGPGELLIDVRAAGVNPADWKIIERGWPGWVFPKAVGLDAAGSVAALGAGVSGFAPGDRVYYHGKLADLGAYAERVVIPSHVVAKIPDSVSFEVAAALPTAGFSAFQVIEERVAPGTEDVVLIHGGAGGLGGMAVQLARRRGATVYATCSASNAAHVRQLGAAEIVDYRTEDVGRRVAELTGGRGVDAVIDTIGPAVGGPAIAMLAFHGWLVCCVGLPDFSQFQPLPRGIRIADIALGWAYLRNDRRAQARLAYYGCELARLVSEGEVDPMIAEVVGFNQAIDALRRSRAGHQRGKLVIRMN